MAGTLNFPPGVTQRMITVPIAHDAEDDDGETFDLTLTNAREAELDGFLPFTGVVRITDVISLVHFAEPGYVVEEGQYAWFEVEIAEPSVLPIEVGYRTSAGTAVAGDDYQPRTGTLRIEPGETRSTSGWVFLYSDDQVEDSETLTIVLENPLNAALGNPASVEMEIIDRDTFQAYNLRALHVEHDLVHLAWGQTAKNVSNQWVATGWELGRRDADLGGGWEVIAETDSSQPPEFWRDFQVVGGTRYEYRVVPVYHPYGADPEPGQESVWTMTEALPVGSGEAAATVLPGYADVIPAQDLPDGVNAFAGNTTIASRCIPIPARTLSVPPWTSMRTIRRLPWIATNRHSHGSRHSWLWPGMTPENPCRGL